MKRIRLLPELCLRLALKFAPKDPPVRDGRATRYQIITDATCPSPLAQRDIRTGYATRIGRIQV